MLSESSPLKIYVNIISNRIIMKIKTRYILELLTPELIKLLGSTDKTIFKDQNVEKVLNLEIISRFIIASNKSFPQLINIFPQSLILSKTYKVQFLSAQVSFNKQNSKHFEI